MSGGQVLVVGLGNLLLGDEGVGVHALRELERHHRLPEHVSLLDGGTKGLDLLPWLEEAFGLLFIDAVHGGGPPGTIYHFDKKELLKGGIPLQVSSHDIALPDLLALLQLRGWEGEWLHLIGVEPEDLKAGTALSPLVARALPQLLEEVLAVLARWGYRICL